MVDPEPWKELNKRISAPGCGSVAFGGAKQFGTPQKSFCVRHPFLDTHTHIQVGSGPPFLDPGAALRHLLKVILTKGH